MISNSVWLKWCRDKEGDIVNDQYAPYIACLPDHIYKKKATLNKFFFSEINCIWEK